MNQQGKLVRIEDYESLIGAQAVGRILKKSTAWRGRRIAHINSTYYGGGVSILLSSLTLLMNSLGIKTGWRVIQGAPDFFQITKKMHHALQGGEPIHLTARKKSIYRQVVYENSVRNHLENHDAVIVHDPQPLPLVTHYPDRRTPWIWRCHLDLSYPDRKLWRYLKPFIEQYDAVIYSVKDYCQKAAVPQFYFMPAIDPFTITNRAMSREEIRERLEHYHIPTDLPLVVQISRFDRWKDPEGVIEAFKIARKKVNATLVLLGNPATDDPEGQKIYESMLKHKEERILLLMCGDDTALVNALQTKAAVVLQKSLREGFGLTVAEAMWKGTPVIGGDTGGIRYQIRDGENGFLVSSVREAAERLVSLLKNKKLRDRMGKKAKESVRRNFLLPRYLEQHLDLLNSFEHRANYF